MSSRPRRRARPPEIEGLPPPAYPAHDGALQITETDCERCGTRLSGLNGRYACGMCGWTNPWNDGHHDLPSAEEDPDHPRRR
ncbi:hypothetical protein [Streptomyces sp. NPDC007883]|uniref:hypothetical protein n=1 Tax=Streptomyces sp. NPDC007883 TaxID=3155116 RepID=UPI0033EBD610